MRTLLILKGLPGCGKSTFAKSLLAKEPSRWKRINRDDLRSMIDDNVWSKTNENFIRSVQELLIRQAIAEGYDVIIDDTNLVYKTIEKLHAIAASIGDIEVKEIGFNVSIDICLDRNSKRIGYAKVPEKVIHDMAKASGIHKGIKLIDKTVKYLAINKVNTNYDPNLPKAMLCDLDGTLAIIGNRSPYDASNCHLIDKPNWAVIECVKAMAHNNHKIVFMSGRDSKYREDTIKFIDMYCSVDNQTGPAIQTYELYMRAENDVRKDSIVKEELFMNHIADRYNVSFICDDRSQVVTRWRQMGLTCFQVAEGNF